MSAETCESLEEIMAECYRLSLHAAYKNYTEKGHCFEPRDEGVLTEDEADLVYGWADGLMYKSYHDRASGHCSIQAMIDFDVVEFEEQCIKNRETIKAILERIGDWVLITKAERIARGWRG